MSIVWQVLAAHNLRRKKEPSTPPDTPRHATPRVVVLCQAFVETVAWDKDPTRFKFVDETSRYLDFVRRYDRAPSGQRVDQDVPMRVGTPLALVGVLTVNGLEAVMSPDGPLNATSFAVYLEQVLCPTLVPGDVVVLGNLPVHKVAGMAAPVETRGGRLLFSPPYSPDFAPIEQA